MSKAKEIVLASSSGDGAAVTVDRKTGVIGNVAVLSAGMAFPAMGEPFEIDATMLQQCADAINANPRGIKSRMSHPELSGGSFVAGGDSIFHQAGRARNARIENGQVRADMAIGNYASTSPHGNMREYLLGIAEEDPGAIGLSIRFLADVPVVRENAAPLYRIAALTAVDFVGTPGGNPDGLLSGESNAAGASPAQTLPAPEQSLGGVEESIMEPVKTPDPVLTPTPAAVLPAPVALAVTPDEKTKAAETALAADRERRAAIVALAAAKDSRVSVEVARQWADEGVSLADAKRLAELAAKLTPVAVSSVESGEDRNLTTIGPAISDALLLRVGAPLMTFDPITGLAARDSEGRIVARKPDDRALTMRRMPVSQMAMQYLAAVGVPVHGDGKHAMLSGEEAVCLASARRGEFAQRLQQAGGNVSLAMSTSDFPYILADALGKVFLGGYNLAPSTIDLWTRRTTTRDFKDVKFLNLGNAPALAVRYEGAEIKFGAMSESRETVALVEYTAGLTWTRRAQINDDLGVLRDGGAQSLGAMARYKESDVGYAILTANAALADTGALFNTTAVTTAGGHANLSSGSSTKVYFAAAPGLYPTITMVFLESEPGPVMKQQVEWSTDDLQVAVRHSVAAKALDFRGLYCDQTGNVTVASVDAVRTAMKTQQSPSPNAAYLNIDPAFIICPVSKEIAFRQLVASTVDPAKTNAVPNPFAQGFTVVADPRLP